MVGLFTLLTGLLAAPIAAGQSSELAYWALDKVFEDGSQLFGDYRSAIDSEESLSEWMKDIPDETPLAHINIPGTHDAGTWNFTSALVEEVYVNRDVENIQNFRCQDQSIAAMLTAGVRFFDLRPALDPTRTYLTIWHGPAEASQLSSLEHIMFAFYAWLESHPSETLLLSFQYQGGTVPGAHQDEKFEQVLYDTFTSPAAQKFISQKAGTLGTLGEARGKIILMKRFDIQYLPESMDADIPGIHLSPSLWTDNGDNITFVYNEETGATVYVQDHYDVGAGESDTLSPAQSIDIKVQTSVAHLDLAAYGSAPDSLFLTFLSSHNLDNDPPMTPQDMALGLDSSATPLGGVNQQLNKYLRCAKNKRLGIVIADFFAQPGGLVQNVLNYNNRLM